MIKIAVPAGRMTRLSLVAVLVGFVFHIVSLGIDEFKYVSEGPNKFQGQHRIVREAFGWDSKLFTYSQNGTTKKKKMKYGEIRDELQGRISTLNESQSSEKRRLKSLYDDTRTLQITGALYLSLQLLSVMTIMATILLTFLPLKNRDGKHYNFTIVAFLLQNIGNGIFCIGFRYSNIFIFGKNTGMGVSLILSVCVSFLYLCGIYFHAREKCVIIQIDTSERKKSKKINC